MKLLKNIEVEDGIAERKRDSADLRRPHFQHVRGYDTVDLPSSTDSHAEVGIVPVDKKMVNYPWKNAKKKRLEPCRETESRSPVLHQSTVYASWSLIC